MKTFKVFACREYPDASDVGLPVDKVSGTANGSPKDFNCTTCTPACYSCHNTMNPRASLFYNFRLDGTYTTDVGTSTKTDTGVDSKISDLLTNGGTPVYHGQEVKTVRQYAKLLSENKTFRDCLARRITNHLMGRSTYAELLPDFQSVRDNIEFNEFNVKKIILEIALHPAFVRR